MRGTRVHALQAHLAGLRQRRSGHHAHLRTQHHQLVNTGGTGVHTHRRHGKQVLYRLRQFAVTVDQLLACLRDLLFGIGGSDLAVRLQAQTLRINVGVRNMRVDGQVNLRFDLALFLLAAVVRHRLADQAQVQVKTNTGNMAGLFAAEQVAGTANLQVLHGQLQARAELVVGRHSLQTLMRNLAEGLIHRVQEVRVGAFAATTHASTQLVQLAQTVVLGVVDNEGVRVRNIQAGLHNGGADQHVKAALPEVHNNLLQARFTHAAVGGGDARLRHELADFRGNIIDISHAVVHEEHLSFTHELAANCGSNLAVGSRSHESQHGVAFLRRGGKGGGLSNTGERHFQGARNWGSTHGEHVHVRAHLLELFLVLHTEALFLVNDDQAQVLEHYAVREDAVRTDHHVHRAGCDFFGNLAGFFRLLEAGKHANLHGEAREALTERLVVLLGEQSRGYEHGDLFAVLYRLECGTYGDLGFAEAHVAGDEAVHGDFFLHVFLHLVDGGELVGSLVVGEGLFQLSLPGGICGEGVATRCLACRIEFHQVGSDFLDCLASAGLGLSPVATAHLGQARVLATHVVGDEVQLVGGHEEAVGCATALGGGVLDDQVFLHGLHAVDRGGASHRAGGHLNEPADAVAFVHHVVAGVQRERVDGVAAAARFEFLSGGTSGCVGSAAAEQFGFGEDGELRLLNQEACGGGRLADLDDAVFDVAGGVRFEADSAGCGYGGCPFTGVE